MGHQRFENWLFEDEPLNAEQGHELQVHLETCPTCQGLANSWQEVERQLAVRSFVQPVPGFTSRWQTRLEANRARSERRMNLVILAASTIGAIVLLALMVIQLFFAFETPAEFFLVSANQLTQAFSGFNVFIEVLAVMVNAIPEVILVGLWVGLTGLAVLSVLWIISIHQFAFQRRILQ